MIFLIIFPQTLSLSLLSAVLFAEFGQISRQAQKTTSSSLVAALSREPTPGPQSVLTRAAFKNRIGKSFENQRKIIGLIIGIVIAILGSFMGEMCLNNRFKSFLELICFRLVQENPDSITL